MRVLNSGYPPLNILTCSSTTKTPTASDFFHAHTNNSVILTPGTWVLNPHGVFGNNGGSPGYNYTCVGVYGANGADSAVTPTLLSATPNLTVNSSYDPAYPMVRQSNTSDLTLGLGPQLIVTATANVTIYVNSLSGQVTSANARIGVYMTARQIK